MKKSSPKPLNLAVRKLPGIIATSLVIFVAGVFSETAAGQEPKASPNRPDVSPPAQSDAGNTASTRTFTDISLEAPFQFKSAPELLGDVSAEIRKSIEYNESFDSVASGNAHAAVYRICYKPKVPVSLDGAMNGAMSNMIRTLSAASGDPNTKFTSNATTTDGLTGRRASYTTNVRGTVVHVDAAFFQSGQKIWMVQVFVAGEVPDFDTKRFLDSVHIKTAR